MSERAVYTIRRGADYTFVLASEVGDDITGYTISAKVKKLLGGRNAYTPSSTVEATFTTSSFAGDATRGPGWYLTLSDTQTLALATGAYLADAKLVTGTTEYITAPWVLDVQDTVSHA